MTDENNQETQITAEQFQAAQAEIERLRKHNETLLAEKKTKINLANQTLRLNNFTTFKKPNQFRLN
ncbi:hypothetical protein LU276_02940 [Moraxella haemolytica]|uniref:hypothetical protein n=1 Tax=Moraxella TaxID=475 RepID=UPI00254291AF|nr:hypothetical protein [Moraxella sp. ZY171148]WII95803.1 hypothetical protein LU276_02940 [Moraxella sp. ZY171148]